MTTEDYQESEVVFQDKFSGNEIRYSKNDKKLKPDNNKKKPKSSNTSSSVPIRIQEEFSGSSWFHHYLQTHSFDVENDEINNEDVEIVPPHVILERRVTRKAAFSLCSGNGRTLKGRDLSQVRDSILRMTGFLES
uniref:uncharacterized protein LOC122597163 n=1 Tax=Erigeron canadensis TaxID=72917 RepID=UPI001CB96B75|nr:uncharacterized protein LOC122597163 [Erigeron canadensis]